MVAQAFDMPTSLLFRGAGVNALRSGQQTSDGQRSVEKLLAALPTYEIDRLYVCAASLTAHALAETQLSLATKVLQPAEVQQLIAEHTIVMGG